MQVSFCLFYSGCPLWSQINGNSSQLHYQPCITFLHLFNLAIIWLSIWPCYLNYTQSETGFTVLHQVYLHYCSIQKYIWTANYPSQSCECQWRENFIFVIKIFRICRFPTQFFEIADFLKSFKLFLNFYEKCLQTQFKHLLLSLLC